MRFDLEVAETGVGFKFFTSRVTDAGETVYDEPAADAGTVFIRPMGPKIEELQARRKRRSEFVLNPKTRAMERVAFDDETPAQRKQDLEDTYDYAIVGWDERVLGKDGTPIPCTRETKLKLMRHPQFDRFFARCQQLLAEVGAVEAEAAEKN